MSEFVGFLMLVTGAIPLILIFSIGVMDPDEKVIAPLMFFTILTILGAWLLWA